MMSKLYLNRENARDARHINLSIKKIATLNIGIIYDFLSLPGSYSMNKSYEINSLNKSSLT